MTKYAKQFDSCLEEIRKASCDKIVAKIWLSGLSHDLSNEATVIIVNARDFHGKVWSFWFVSADSIQELVMESETKDWVSTPGEILVIIDRCTPERLVETIARYLDRTIGVNSI